MNRRQMLRTILVACAGVAIALVAAAAEEPPIELPPMLVSDLRSAKPWLVAEAPGFELLARCDEDLAQRFLRRNLRLMELLRRVLPDELRLTTTQPRQIVLVEAEEGASLSQSLVAAFSAARTDSAEGASARRLDQLSAPREVKMLPNLQLPDMDGLTVFAVIDPRQFADGRLTFDAGHLRLVLERRVAALPRWYVEGMMRYFGNVQFQDEALEVAPLTWISDAETKRLASDPDAPREIDPLRDFWAAAGPPADPSGAGRWRSQAELLVRWGLVPERRVAFWALVAALAAGADPEAELQRRFQLNAADLRDQLSDLLPGATRRWEEVRLTKLPPPPRVTLRRASPADIGRLKGDWERLAYGFVKARHPEYAPRYLALVTETLARARERAPEDPALAGVAGLLACDCGDRATARPLLELAATGVRARPRVEAELAVLRLEELLHEGDYGAGRISSAQADVVLQALSRALASQPPLPMTAALRAEVWARSGRRLAPDDLAALRSDLARFPRSPALLYFAAVLEAREGALDAAIALADRGVAAEGSAEANARFRELRTKLLAAKRPTGSDAASLPEK